MLQDSEFIKVQGICGGGYWLRYVRNGKIYNEQFVHTMIFESPTELAEFWDTVTGELIEFGRIQAGKSDKFDGFLIAYKREDGKVKSTPIFDCDLFVEHADVDEIEDNVVRHVKDVQNKCFAIISLLESIQSDLNLISIYHIDDNGKELAEAVGDGFKALQDFIEEMFEQPLGKDWRHETLPGVLYYLHRDKEQTLVIPEIRRSRIENILKAGKADQVTPEMEEEAQSCVDYVREQFKLSKKWR